MPDDPARVPTEVDQVSERLTAPLPWWLLSTGFVLSIGVAVFAFLGPVWGIAVTVVGEALVLAGLISYGGTQVVVGPDGLGVGRSWIDYEYVGAVQALDEQQTRQRLRTSADPRAYLVIRPYIRTSLEITVDDPADPHPYWLVSARGPVRLLGRVPARLRRPAPADQ